MALLPMAQKSSIIAEAIMEIARENGPVDITPMKLLKLVYIAHGWSFAYFNEPLITDRIEAWKYGPVIPSLYHQIKKFGVGNVPTGSLCGGNAQNRLAPQQIELLKAVWSGYGSMDAMRLSMLTHREGSPWDIVWNQNHGSTYKGAVIDAATIKEHYRKMLNERGIPQTC